MNTIPSIRRAVMVGINQVAANTAISLSTTSADRFKIVGSNDAIDSKTPPFAIPTVRITTEPMSFGDDRIYDIDVTLAMRLPTDDPYSLVAAETLAKAIEDWGFNTISGQTSIIEVDYDQGGRSQAGTSYDSEVNYHFRAAKYF